MYALIAIVCFIAGLFCEDKYICVGMLLVSGLFAIAAALSSICTFITSLSVSVEKREK